LELEALAFFRHAPESAPPVRASGGVAPLPNLQTSWLNGGAPFANYRFESSGYDGCNIAGVVDPLAGDGTA